MFSALETIIQTRNDAKDRYDYYFINLYDESLKEKEKLREYEKEMAYWFRFRNESFSSGSRYKSAVNNYDNYKNNGMNATKKLEEEKELMDRVVSECDAIINRLSKQINKQGC